MQAVSHSPPRLNPSPIARQATPRVTPLAKLRADIEPKGKVSERSYGNRLAEGFALLSR